MTEAEAREKARRLNRELGHSLDAASRTRFYLERELASGEWVVELCGTRRTSLWRDRIVDRLIKGVTGR